MVDSLSVRAHAVFMSTTMKLTKSQKQLLRTVVDEAIDAAVQEGIDPGAAITPGCYLLCKAFELLEASGALGLEDELRARLGLTTSVSK